MCKALLCWIYTTELQSAQKRLSDARKQKRYEHYLDTIDLEIDAAQSCVNAAQAKIDALHLAQKQASEGLQKTN